MDGEKQTGGSTAAEGNSIAVLEVP